MATVANPVSQHKPAKAFHAQLHGLSGILTRTAEGRILFLEHESSAVVTITQADAPNILVLGELATSMMQMVLDLVESRAAKACSRSQEVR